MSSRLPGPVRSINGYRVGPEDLAMDVVVGATIVTGTLTYDTALASINTGGVVTQIANHSASTAYCDASIVSLGVISLKVLSSAFGQATADATIKYIVVGRYDQP